VLRIDLSKQALAFLETLPDKQTRQIVSRIDLLAADPESVPNEILRGANGERRIKVGEFRVIYLVAADVLQIVLIDRRNDDRIYRRFRRL
jgi:mRNA interferase RelE/StbE